jgi:hypothetical protein
VSCFVSFAQKLTLRQHNNIAKSSRWYHYQNLWRLLHYYSNHCPRNNLRHFLITAILIPNFIRCSMGDNTGLPPMTTPSQLDDSSNFINIVNLTGCMMKKSDRKKSERKNQEVNMAETKKLSPHSSVNLPSLQYPSGSRLIPNTSGSKEAASTARYWLDSNDLHLECMFRTEIALLEEHIRGLRDVTEDLCTRV